MFDTFSEEWAHQVIRELREQGVEFIEGFVDDHLAEVEAVFGVPLPAELATFLRAGVPVGPKWPDWGSGASAVRDGSQSWIDRAFAFDIENNTYWHPLFGERPTEDRQAVEVALHAVRAAPPLIPIYAHRFLATAPSHGTRGVLSVWQAVDSILYGNDLADFFAAEFRVTRPEWAAATEPAVPVWEELLDLWCVGDDA